MVKVSSETSVRNGSKVRYRVDGVYAVITFARRMTVLTGRSRNCLVGESLLKACEENEPRDEHQCLSLPLSFRSCQLFICATNIFLTSKAESFILIQPRGLFGDLNRRAVAIVSQLGNPQLSGSSRSHYETPPRNSPQ